MKRFTSSTNDALENPLRGGFMIACWQNGRRVMMHSSEVARLMTKNKRRSAAEESAPSSISSCSRLSRASTPSREESKGVDHRDKPGDDDLDRAIAARGPTRPGNDEKEGLTPPPPEPRSRAITKNKNWQLLAKLVMNACNASRSCHKPACRRAHRCAGGHDACYLREFETVDAVIRRDVLRALQRAGGETGEEAE